MLHFSKHPVRLLLAALLCCCLFGGLIALADGTAVTEAELDGVKVSFSTDKSEYAGGEKISLTVNAEGTHAADVGAVFTVELNGEIWGTASDRQEIQPLTGSSASVFLSADVTPEEPVIETEAPTESQSESRGSEDDPSGGFPVWAIVLIAVAVIAVILFLVLGKKKGKGAAAMLLVFVLLAEAAAPAVKAGELTAAPAALGSALLGAELTAEAPDGALLGAVDARLSSGSYINKESFELSVPVTVDGKEATVKALVTIGIVYTRVELEQIMTEVAWAYANKADRMQYNYANMNTTIDRYHGSPYNLTEEVSPEYITSDSKMLSHCADYVYQILLEAFGYHMMNAAYYGDVTCENTYMISNEEAPETVLIRYQNPQTISNYINPAAHGIEQSDCVSTMKELRSYMGTDACNLRPGDVYTIGVPVGGHMMFYAGDGQVLHCTGNGYDFTNACDKKESYGGIRRMTVDYLWLREGSNWNMLDESEAYYAFFFRPLNAIVVEDGDGDLDNDRLSPAYYVTDADRSRVKYPALTIDRTVNLGGYPSVASGSSFRCDIYLENRTAGADSEYYAAYPGRVTDYKDLVITETIPEGAELVEGSITEGGRLENGQIVWTIDLEAGKTVTLSYKLKATAERGSTILLLGGKVDGIPFAELPVIVGGQLISDESIAKLEKLGNTPVSKWNITWADGKDGSARDGLSLFEAIYKQTMGIDLQLPTLTEFANYVFQYDKRTRDSRATKVAGKTKAQSGFAYELLPEDQIADEYKAAYEMIVNGFVNGRDYLQSEVGADMSRWNKLLMEIRGDYFQPGDIFVLMNANTSKSIMEYDEIMLNVPSLGELKAKLNYKLLLCIDEVTFICLNYDNTIEVLDAADVYRELWTCFTYGLIFNLRPSLAYDDINTLK